LKNDAEGRDANTETQMNSKEAPGKCVSRYDKPTPSVGTPIVGKPLIDSILAQNDVGMLSNTPWETDTKRRVPYCRDAFHRDVAKGRHT
jgi:hypothetical protein